MINLFKEREKSARHLVFDKDISPILVAALYSYFSVTAMIGDAHRKIRQTNQKTLAMFEAVRNGGFTMVKNPPKLIQKSPTIFFTRCWVTIIDCK
jgi:hypothetical protein